MEDYARGVAGLDPARDPFTRNSYRGSARAYAADPLAQETVLEGIEVGHDRSLSPRAAPGPTMRAS